MDGTRPVPPTVSSGRYRGVDRRTRPGEVDRQLDAPIGRAVALLSAAALAIVGFASVMPAEARVLGPLTRVDIAAGALLVVAGVETLMRWRLDGRAFGWWTGIALIVLGVPGLAAVTETHAGAALQVGASAVAAIFFLAAVRSAEIDTALTIARAVLAVLAGIGATVLLGAAALSTPLLTTAGPVWVLVIFGLLAVAYRRPPRCERWLILTIVSWGLAQLALICVADEAAQLAAAALIHTATGIFAVGGAALGLQLNARVHRTVAFESEKQREIAEARHAETLHEVRSTVVALEGGIRTLEPRSEPSLPLALGAELNRLRGLVEPEHADLPQRFVVREALEPLLTVCAAGGWPVRWSIPDDLTCVGRAADVAQITHGLITNARRYAPGTPIEVEAVAEDGYAVIRVSDRGPGVEGIYRRRIFERGGRAQCASAANADSHGLGLHIARRLARNVGGELWVEPRRGGGATFVLIVPGAETATEVRVDLSKAVG